MLRRILLILAFLSLLPFPALAGFDEGKAAYDRKDWTKTIQELRPLAEAGDDRAMIILANMYHEGFGVMQSDKEAMSLYKRAAAEKNNTDAMMAVGAMYTSGLGVMVKLSTAMQWYKRAAQLGDQTGAFFYASILYRGNKSTTDDIKPDIYNSYKWFKIAANGKKYPEIVKRSQKFVEALAKQKMTAEDVVKADKEVSEWKPLDAASLGPLPDDPAPAPAASAETQPEPKKP